jgi:hypothetical protein
MSHINGILESRNRVDRLGSRTARCFVMAETDMSGRSLVDPFIAHM